MWQQYCKTFIPMQIFIAGVCLAFIFIGHAPANAVIGPFVVMEIAAIYGARWAMRLKGPSEKGTLKGRL